MDDGNVVTIVAVVVAGALSPWIAGKIAGQAQGKRLEHERTLHDLDDLRRQFDAVGEALGHYIRAVADLAGTRAEAELPARTDLAYRCGSIAVERVAHLRFRLEEDDAVVVSAMEVLNGLDEVRREHQQLSSDEVRERMLDAGDANVRFYRASKRWIKSRVVQAA
jgi:hypothetical protein